MYFGVNISFRFWGSHSGEYEEFYPLDITPPSPLKVGRSSGEAYILHFLGRRMSQARNHQEAARKQSQQ
jgi:hypothetical protein